MHAMAKEPMQAQLLSLFQLFIQLHFANEITETLQRALDNLGIKTYMSNIVYKHE